MNQPPGEKLPLSNQMGEPYPGAVPPYPPNNSMVPPFNPQHPGYGGVGYYQPPPPQQPIIIMPQQQPQQPQQSMIINNNVGGGTTLVYDHPFRAHKSLACFTFWCCNVLFGLIGFILAMVADGMYRDSPNQARRLGKASLGISISGIIISISTVIIVLSLFFTGNLIRVPSTSYGIYTPFSTSSSSSYCSSGLLVSGICYSSRVYKGSCSYSTASLCCSYPYNDLYYNYYCYSY